MMQFLHYMVTTTYMGGGGDVEKPWCESDVWEMVTKQEEDLFLSDLDHFRKTPVSNRTIYITT